MKRPTADEVGINTSENAPTKLLGATGPRSRYGPGKSIWPEWGLQSLVGALVIAYGVSTIVVHRPPSGYNTIWDGWIYNVAGTLPILPVLLRVRRRAELRSAWLAVAAGVFLNTVGNLVYTYHDQNLNPMPSPAPSDAFYLLSDAAVIVGFAILTQSSFGRAHASVRVDGAIAGLAIAAVAGMVWFEPVLQVSGRPLQVVVGMAYPLADLVLVVLLVAALAPQRFRPNWPTLLLLVGTLCWVVGDVVYLNQSASNSYVPGTVLDTTWPLGIFFMTLAASLPDRRRTRRSGGTSVPPTGITLVPVVFGMVSVGVIAACLTGHHSAVVVSLALSAVLLVIGRMWATLREVRQLSLHEVRQSAANYQDARTDYLTGLPNRRAFLERVQTTFLSQNGMARQAGVLLIDLDGFKEVNDALGHVAGDELLCVVARRFDHRLGGRGILARLGGDEYAFACAVDSEEGLVAMANELSQALEDPCALDGISVRVGASVGVALSPPGGSSVEELLRCADVAMYEAKRTQCGVSVYRPEADPHSRDRFTFIDGLRDAIDERAFILHYQPTLDIRSATDIGSATVHGVEALVRWPHPSAGLLYPDRFVPLAEHYGMMPQLTRAVLDQAVAQAAHLDRAGRPLQMSVNISRYDLVDEGLADYIDDILALNGVPPDRLTLEVTESAIGGDPERAARCVADLRSRGLRVSIDDFGVGYSSMSQLLRLTVDELKIDKSFVVALTSDLRALAIVRSAIELARALDLTVVAEGIESEAAFQSLRRIGADIGQGYVISHPLTSHQLDEYLARRSRVRRLLPDLASAPS